MDKSDSGGRWLFVGLLCGAALMIGLYGLPQPFFGLVSPECDVDCAKDLDLQAQQAMAASTWLTFVVAALSTGVGVVSLWLIWRNLVATREIVQATKAANATMIQVAHDQSRAYLDAIGAKAEVGMSDTVIVKYANAGQSPARRVRISVDFSVEHQIGDGWRSMATRFGRTWKPALPSGDKASARVRVPSVFNDVFDDIDNDANGSYRLVARGKLSFNDVFNERHHAAFQFRSRSYSGSAIALLGGDEYELERLPEPKDDLGDD